MTLSHIYADTVLLILDECNKKCPLIHAPVCGSDGTTYDNQCTLQAKACAEKAEIHIMHEGKLAHYVLSVLKTSFWDPRCQTYVLKTQIA